MPPGLKRLQRTGNLHFVTFSCHERRPYLGTPVNRDLFLRTLEKTCLKYQAVLDGFVIMPEHVHLLLYEPAEIALSTMIQALKCSVSKQSEQRPFWYPRYYDFNIFTQHKRTEKLTYMACNPVKRGLSTTPETWPWSSAAAPSATNPGAPSSRS